MTKPTYAYGPTQLPSPIVTKTSGGNLTSAVQGTYYFRLQGRNRVGRNQLSEASLAVTVAAGDRVTVEIPAAARTDCSDWRYFVISVSTSTLASTFKQIAWVPGYEADEVTPIALPTTIELTEDAHLIGGETVLAIADLPSGAALIDGMVRGVFETTYFYTYNETSTEPVNSPLVLAGNPAGRWLRSGPSETSITNIAEAGGCAIDIRDLGETPVLEPDYTVSLNTRNPGIPVKLWRVNDSTEPILAGTRIGITVQYNEETKTLAFNGLLKVKFLGYANPATGELDTEDEFGTGQMRGVGDIVPMQARKSNLILEKDLPAGWAYAIEIYPEFAGVEVEDDIAINSDLKVYLFFYLSQGEFSEAGLALGEDWIYPVGDKRRVVPDGGLGVALLSGSYMVESFSVRGLGRSPAIGLQPNTANQKICINGLGASWLETGTVPDSAALRALVGTIDGRGSAGPPSIYGSIAASGQMRVTIPYPCNSEGIGTVRTNYPDRLAGNNKGRFNPSAVVLYVQQQATGEIREFSGTSVIADVSQEIVISSWAAGSVIASIPTAAANFGLFIPGQPTISTVAGGGDFASGSYRVWAAFDYLNRVTSISHDPVDGCIFEPDSTLVEVFDRIRYHAQGAQNLAALRLVPLANVSDLQSRVVKNPRRLYLYDVNSMGVDDGSADSRFVRLNEVPPDQPGRFVHYNELFEIGVVEEGVEGESPRVWISDGPNGKEINFLIPPGERGRTGPAPKIEIGNVIASDFEFEASAKISGYGGNYVIDFVLPRGDRGPSGPAGKQGPKGETGNPMDPIQFIEFGILYG